MALRDSYLPACHFPNDFFSRAGGDGPKEFHHCWQRVNLALGVILESAWRAVMRHALLRGRAVPHSSLHPRPPHKNNNNNNNRVDNRMGNTSNTSTWAQVSQLPSTTFVGSPEAKEVRASHRRRGGEDGGP